MTTLASYLQMTIGKNKKVPMILPPILSNSLLFLILIIISFKDFKERIIPDVFLLIIAFLGILQWGFAHRMSIAILGLIAYGLYKLYPLLKHQEGLGFGDVKMMMASGVWLDPSQIPFFLILGGTIGIGIALFWRIFQKERRFPLGPAFAVALGMCVLNL